MKNFLVRLVSIFFLITTISACTNPILDKGDYMREGDRVRISIPGYSGGKWSFSVGFRGDTEYLPEIVNLKLGDGSLSTVSYLVEGKITANKTELLGDIDKLATDFQQIIQDDFSLLTTSQFDSNWDKTVKLIEAKLQEQLNPKATARGLAVDKVTLKIRLPAPVFNLSPERQAIRDAWVKACKENPQSDQCKGPAVNK